MRHRTYKHEHLPASIRPTVAAALVRLADLKPNQTVLDPMCGAGTLLAEAHLATKGARPPTAATGRCSFIGGDIDSGHVRAAQANLRQFGITDIRAWDARELPIDDASIDRILCNPPFGKQLEHAGGDRAALPRIGARDGSRLAARRQKRCLIVADAKALRSAAERVGWKEQRHVQVRMLGQRAFIGVYRKPAAV